MTDDTGPFGGPSYVDKDKLRSEVSMAAVAAELGVLVDESGYATCPFHNDEKPSFHIFADPAGVERYACYPCGVRGDVYDLLQALTGCSFNEAIRRLEKMRGTLPPPPRREPSQPFDLDSATQLVEEAQAYIAWQPGWLCVISGLRNDADLELDSHLRGHWRWGAQQDGTQVFPHFSVSGQLTGVKFRSMRGEKWSYPGSTFHALYGAWRTREHRTLILCEGETDAAWASAQFPPADVLALPSGAQRWLDVWSALEADRYILAFDADDPGRSACEKWESAFPGKTWRVELPQGEDLKSARYIFTDTDFGH